MAVTQMNDANDTITAPINVRSAHLSEVAKKNSGEMSRKEHQALMESYWGRIPEAQRVTSLRLVAGFMVKSSEIPSQGRYEMRRRGICLCG